MPVGATDQHRQLWSTEQTLLWYESCKQAQHWGMGQSWWAWCWHTFVDALMLFQWMLYSLIHSLMDQTNWIHIKNHLQFLIFFSNVVAYINSFISHLNVCLPSFLISIFLKFLINWNLPLWLFFFCFCDTLLEHRASMLEYCHRKSSCSHIMPPLSFAYHCKVCSSHSLVWIIYLQIDS